MRASRWPLAVIAAPAAVAIWSGWVGLGELCGFGPVQLLPGISDLTINTAITLPVGVEAYAAYALRAWVRPDAPEPARKFARRSAVGALAYGMFGQIVYHLLAARHAQSAPVPVVVIVSCMPVAVVAFAAALMHLLHAPAGDTEDAQEGKQPESSPAPAPAASVSVSLPGVRELQREHQASYPTAKKIRAAIKADRAKTAPAGVVPPASLAGAHPNGDGRG